MLAALCGMCGSTSAVCVAQRLHLPAHLSAAPRHHPIPCPLAPATSLAPPCRYSDIEDRAAILGKLLQWRHLAPTAPDTLAAYPYFESDPFILDSSPHVLFAGGQPAFATGVAEVQGGGSVRLVAVPNFCTTGCVVLVNLSTLACQPIYFDDAMQG